MSEKLVRFICYFFAVIALITGSAALLTGLNLVPDVQTIEASSDNEFRFFSVFWLAYGIFCAWVARDLIQRGGFIPALALVMFVGGVGRVLSIVLVGIPVDMYLWGAGVELVVPAIWFAAYKKSCEGSPADNL